MQGLYAGLAQAPGGFMEHLDAATTRLTPAALARVQDLQAEVTESARARSYYSISTGTQIGDPSAVPFLTPRVKKCLIHVL